MLAEGGWEAGEGRAQLAKPWQPMGNSGVWQPGVCPTKARGRAVLLQNQSLGGGRNLSEVCQPRVTLPERSVPQPRRSGWDAAFAVRIKHLVPAAHVPREQGSELGNLKA